jgi:choline kinase
MNQECRAVILAAGQGTRLRPLTDGIPKCLVPVNGKPILEYQLESLRAEGISEITVLAGYKQEMIVYSDITKELNTRYAEMNMVGTLFNSKALADENSDVVLSYGDIIYERHVLRALLSSDAPVSVVIDLDWLKAWSTRMENPLDDAETLVLTEDGNISEIGKKPHSLSQIEGQFVGLIKISASSLAMVKNFWQMLDREGSYDGNSFDDMYTTSLLQLMIDAGWQIKAIPVNGGWLEIDTPEDLQAFDILKNLGYLPSL